MTSALQTFDKIKAHVRLKRKLIDLSTSSEEALHVKIE